MYTKVFCINQAFSWFCLSENIEVNLSSMKIHTGFVSFLNSIQKTIQKYPTFISVFISLLTVFESISVTCFFLLRPFKRMYDNIFLLNKGHEMHSRILVSSMWACCCCFFICFEGMRLWGENKRKWQSLLGANLYK